MTTSQISSHYAGMLKAHAASPEQQFAWEALMTLACEVERLKRELETVKAVASEASSQTARIGGP